MRTALAALAITISATAAGQEYYCGVATAGTMQLKLVTTFDIQDNRVTLINMREGKYDSTSYERVQATNQKSVYFTDGVMLTTLDINESVGKMKGFAYTHVITMIPDKRVTSQTVGYFCTKR